MARAKVFEAVEDARRDLPDDVREIYVNTFSTTQIPVLEARISAPGRDLSANYERLERRIADPIRRISGVARVELNGVEPREVRINLRLDRLTAHRVDLSEVTERVAAMNRNVSLGRIRAGDEGDPGPGLPGALRDPRDRRPAPERPRPPGLGCRGCHLPPARRSPTDAISTTKPPSG